MYALHAYMRPIATDVAHSMICVSVYWARPWVLQK